MKFRPCIDIHNGKVKQIVGGSLQDAGNRAKENFVSEMSAADYADLYKKKHLRGGHVILLNPAGSEYYEEDRRQAEEALAAYPDGLQVGGGITVENAAHFIQSGCQPRNSYFLCICRRQGFILTVWRHCGKKLEKSTLCLT